MPSSKRPPPLDFSPVRVCTWAELISEQPEFIHRHKRRGRRLLGIKYEAAAQLHFKKQYGDNYTSSQWIRFQADGSDRYRWCQPDGILVDPVHKVMTIVECKYQHTENAWWQLFRLYKPVLERLFNGRGFTIKCVEVCKWFDPSTAVPEPVVMCKTIEAVEAGQFGVHIWKP